MRTVKHTGESAIVSIGRFPIVFLQLGLNFPYDKGDVLVEICILLILLRFGSYKRKEKWETNKIIDHL